MSANVYVVTDIEVDGFWPGRNSMLSFASVAVTESGERRGVFEAVLDTLPGAAGEAGTLAWWRSQPAEVWAAARENPRPAADVMSDWVAWVQSLGAPTVFAASPVAFDGLWMDYYLREFTPHGLVEGPNVGPTLFTSTLCLRSMALGVAGGDPASFLVASLPSDWLGDVAHTHRAVDDALGYANLLVTLLRRAAT